MAINQNHGIVAGEAIMGANIFKDMFAGIRNIIGGRLGAYDMVFTESEKQEV